ncbi:uncharacterized protein LOC141574606 [Camelus bactrianus]|uniref:Uncharacterized protein LOC141574606 n=1 Tax=Camelus bactrianus TaxID=9837 RepID=A0AC58P7V9_CAMBA
MTVRHIAEEKGRESSWDEEGATVPEIRIPEYSTGTVEVPPQELTDHNTLTSVFGAQGGYYTLADAGPGAAPVWPGSARPPAATPEAQATPWAGGPQPFREPTRVACPVSGPLSPSWAPAPCPPWCPVQPRPPPPAAPLGHCGFQRSRYLSRTTWCASPDGTPSVTSQRLFVTATPTSLVAYAVSATATPTTTSYSTRTVRLPTEGAPQLWQ